MGEREAEVRVDEADEPGAVEARPRRAAAVGVAGAGEPLRVVDDPHAEGEVRLGGPGPPGLALEDREWGDHRVRVGRWGWVGRRRVAVVGPAGERLQEREPERERDDEHGDEEAASQHGESRRHTCSCSPSSRMSSGGHIRPWTAASVCPPSGGSPYRFPHLSGSEIEAKEGWTTADGSFRIREWT